MRRLAPASALLLTLAACGDGPADAPSGTPSPDAPTIATDMESPVERPFCTFTAENAAIPAGSDTPPYVFVTAMGDSVYNGYAKLDGAVEKLIEVEAGFGAGMETRRYVSEDDSVELEVILLDAQEGQMTTEYTGSVRVIYPVEGPAVKFYGECQYDEAGE